MESSIRGGRGKNLPLLAKATRTGERYRVPDVATRRRVVRSDRAIAGGGGARILISVAQIKPTLEEFFMNLVEADRAQANAVEVSGKMKNVRTVAANTFREAVRDRVLYNLVFFALLMMGRGILVGQISIGIEESGSSAWG